MDVDDASLIRAHEVGAQNGHKSRKDDKLDIVSAHNGEDDLLPLGAVGKFPLVDDDALDMIARRALQDVGVLVVRDDEDHLPVGDEPRLLRVDDRLKIGAAARTEDGDARLSHTSTTPSSLRTIVPRA